MDVGGVDDNKLAMAGGVGVTIGLTLNVAPIQRWVERGRRLIDLRRDGGRDGKGR
jgi:hypothetical protein